MILKCCNCGRKVDAGPGVLIVGFFLFCSNVCAQKFEQALKNLKEIDYVNNPDHH